MRRWFLVLFTLVFSLPVTAFATAQTPDATGLPTDQRILRLTPVDGYAVLVNAEGSALEGEFYQWTAGAAAIDLSGAVTDFYAANNVQDVYQYYTNLSADGGVTALSVEIRVATFDDADSAAGFVATLYDFVVTQAAADTTTPQEIAPLDPLPDLGDSISGWSASAQFYDLQTGEPIVRVPGYRYVTQTGTTAVSIAVYGNDGSVTPALAESLLVAQLACADAGTPCEPLPLAPDAVSTSVRSTS
jgi:hypothetical protein